MGKVSLFKYIRTIFYIDLIPFLYMHLSVPVFKIWDKALCIHCYRTSTEVLIFLYFWLSEFRLNI